LTAKIQKKIKGTTLEKIFLTLTPIYDIKKLYIFALTYMRKK
jgi:hypothetical protein